MLQLEGICKSYSGESLFEDVSFSLQKGERCGLIGRNGTGKTTLFRLIIEEEFPDQGVISKSKNYSIGYLDQHIAFSCSSVVEEAALGLSSNDQDSLYKVEKILFGLGFQEPDLQRRPADLSGGFHLRLHLAKVLVAEPDLLLLDEPTNYLDIISIRWLSRFLKMWKGEFILISHDREFMDEVTSHTLGIHRKKIHKIHGKTGDLFAQILQEEEVYERTRVNVEKKRAHAEAFINRFGAKATKAAQAQSRLKSLQRMPALEKLAELHHLDFQFRDEPFSGKVMLQAEDLSFAYSGIESDRLIRDFSLIVEREDRIAVIGKNGRGKSTILRLLAEELKPQKGKIKRSERLKIGYFGQTNIDRLNFSHTIEEEIAAANPQLSVSEIRAICGVMMFSGDRAKKAISVLSGGERSRVLIGKILANPCHLLLLDEPTHHLDMESIEALMNALEIFQGSVVIVTHSELILHKLSATQLIICKQGKQDLFLGNYEDFLAKQGWGDVSIQIPEKTTASYWDQKQKRAELISNRSRELKPLEKQIQNLEKQIMDLEAAMHKEQEALIEASMQGQSSRIQELSKQIALKTAQVEDLYRQLEQFSLQYEEKKAEFHKAFQELV